MLTYQFTCPSCHQPCIVKRSSASPAPIYCKMACRQAGRSRQVTWRKFFFDDLINALIKKAAHGKYGSLKALWRTDARFEAAGIPYPVVCRQAWNLGCVRSTGSRTIWSAEELAFAGPLYLQGRPVDLIAKAMRAKGWQRSPGAIVRRMQTEQLSRRQGDYYTMTSLAQALNVDTNVVGRWIARYGLPVHHRSGGAGNVAFLAPKSVRAWMLDNMGLVAKVATPDLVWFAALLVPQGAGDTADYGSADDAGVWMNGQAVLDRADAGD